MDYKSVLEEQIRELISIQKKNIESKDTNSIYKLAEVICKYVELASKF